MYLVAYLIVSLIIISNKGEFISMESRTLINFESFHSSVLYSDT